jgi:hypothetical protein
LGENQFPGVHSPTLAQTLLGEIAKTSSNREHRQTAFQPFVFMAPDHLLSFNDRTAVMQL